MSMPVIDADFVPAFCSVIVWAVLVVPMYCGPNQSVVGKAETSGPTSASPVGDFAITNVCGAPCALVDNVTVPFVLPSLAPTRINVQPVPGANVLPQLPPIVKLADGTIELITSGELLTLRSVRIGLTRGERLISGPLLPLIFEAKIV